MAPFKVIVVGGGLAGALLANGLQNNNVDVTVYERDKKDSERGYQIRLGESAMLGFRACLRDQDIATIARSFGQSSMSGSTAPTIMSSRCEEILNLTTIPSYTKSFAISRSVLRDILTEPLGLMEYEYAFSWYEIVRDIDGNERVRVYFSDSSFDDCDILVGADGSHSRVSRARPESNTETELNRRKGKWRGRTAESCPITTHWSFLAKGSLSMEQVYELSDQLRRGPILVFAKGVTLYYSCSCNPSPPFIKDIFEKVNSISSIPPQTEETDDTDSSGRDERKASFFWVSSIPGATLTTQV